MYGDKSVEVRDLLWKTLIAIKNYDDELYFITSDDEEYKMYHSQDCCESVFIDDICGDLRDLVGSPLLVAEEVSSEPPTRDKDAFVPESETWTFYKFATIRGTVTIRWHGTSNGYYSEGVDFVKL